MRILDDLPAGRDLLDFEPYVAAIAEMVSDPSTRTPLTMGLFGSWGSGKTSLMMMVQNKLPEHCQGVWFDPWRYGGEESLWRALLLKVLGSLKAAIEEQDEKDALSKMEDLETSLYRSVEREKVGGVQIDWGKLAAGAGQSGLQIGLSFIPGAKMLADLLKALKDKGEKSAAENLLSAIHRERSKLHIEQVQFLDQFQDKFRSLVNEHIVKKNRCLVVFVDDLDRCLPEKAVEVLESIKLFLDVPGCVFLLGLDQDVITRAVENKYRELGKALGVPDEGKAEFLISGARYLEKIIQLPFRIPPIEKGKMTEFVSRLIEQWPHEECPRVFAEALGNNPRQVKRTINVFLFLWHLVTKRQIGDIKPVRLAKVVAIQHIYPELYNRLQATPHLLSDLEKYYLSQSRLSIEKGDNAQKEKLEPPSVLVPFLSKDSVRRLLILHPPERVEFNFTGLKPDEIRLYFTLTRRTEVPGLTPSTANVGVMEPQLVSIPAGTFLMGSNEDDKNANDNEKPQHKIELPEYTIGKYPVTNAEYQAFVKDTGHQPPSGWEGSDYPEDRGDHPVVNVSWHDAVAYCEWLRKKTGKQYRLPTEAQWEKAARGTDGRIFPWGNTWDPSRLNSSESGTGGTSPVGRYSPKGDSPFGASDMAGNVWEWTRSLWGKDWKNPAYHYPYNPDDGREDLEAGNQMLRVLRGGSFGSSAAYVRCACRGRDLPDYWHHHIGFRVVLAP
ncbi:MAG: SUMF1/EgtB/PvdO family nonheme iron enzyme [Desulfobacterales bacterium]|nr:SUMF1/EgtB/PvdO family nonheme iron enzyme [Desulfobacterales bacterium]